MDIEKEREKECEREIRKLLVSYSILRAIGDMIMEYKFI